MTENNKARIMSDSIRDHLLRQGAGAVGFVRLTDGPPDLPFAVSLLIPLSNAIIDEITGAPTHTYFHHYRTVNAFIDRLQLETGLFLQQKGYRYLPIAASQSIPMQGVRTHHGRYSHKKAAVSAGLGRIGKNALFMHPVFGPRVRLGTVFTDCPLSVPTEPEAVPVPDGDACGSCDLCSRACPAGAIRSRHWHASLQREDLIDADACNRYMRDHFMKIGRGSVCGICMKVCPQFVIHRDSGDHLEHRP